MQFDTINVSVNTGVMILTLSRPNSLNALNKSMLDELLEALGRISTDPSTRVLVLSGSGRAFCSGADIVKGTGANREGEPYDGGLILETHLNPLLELMAGLHVPIVSVVHGPAAGAGCSLALAADFVIAARSAYFYLAFSRVGLVPDSGLTWLLPRLVGLPRALQMMLLAERIPAEKALEWGMIYSVVDDAQLTQAANELAQRLANGPTMAFGLMRKSVRAGLHSSFNESLGRERIEQRLSGLSEDFREGVNAYIHKRQPDFRGR